MHFAAVAYVGESTLDPLRYSLVTNYLEFINLKPYRNETVLFFTDYGT